MAEHASEVCRKRAVFAVICSVTHQVCVLLMHMVVTHADPLHPLLWMKNVLSVITSVKLILCTTLATILTSLQIFFMCKKLFQGPLYNRTRFIALARVFSLNSVYFLLLTLLMSFLLGNLYFAVRNNAERASHEDYVFHCFITIFAGIYFAVHDYMNGLQMIQLTPVAALPAMAQLKQLVKKAFKASIWPSIKAVVYFHMFFYICGGSFLNMFLDKPDVSFLNLFHLFSIGSIMYSYLSVYSVLVVLSTMKNISVMALSKPLKFPLTASAKFEKCILLHEALSMHSMPAVQLLASNDLKEAVEKDPFCRAELFMLSQPGGHPHNWRKLVKSFYSIIDEFCDDISLNPTIVQTPKPMTNPELPRAPLSPNIRNMCLFPPMHVRNENVVCPPASTKPCLWIRQQVDVLLKKPPFAFMLGERPEERVANAFILRGQAVMYLVSAMATLIRVSYDEDVFGVIQQDLPVVMSSLLKLKVGVDKLGNLLRRPNSCGQVPLSLYMKSALRETVTRSMYKVVSVFQPHLKDMSLVPEIESQLSNFISFKES